MHLHPVVRFAGKIPKHGNAPTECEDDFCHTENVFGVADGASDGIYSDLWARILVESYCRTNAIEWNTEQFCAWVDDCRARWQEWEEQVVAKDLPWFAREKLRNGSFATFAGLTFSSDFSGAWKAVVYGDACLFIIRDDQLVLSFPLTTSDEFDNSPPLVATTGDLADRSIRIADGTALLGDRFYLATDALAQWFLADYERGEKPWIAFDGIAGSSELDLFVAESREQRLLRNDDVTLVSVEMLVQE